MKILFVTPKTTTVPIPAIYIIKINLSHFKTFINIIMVPGVIKYYFKLNCMGIILI